MQTLSGLQGRRLPCRTEPARPAEGAAWVTMWRKSRAEPVGGRQPRVLAQVPPRSRLRAGPLEEVLVLSIEEKGGWVVLAGPLWVQTEPDCAGWGVLRAALPALQWPGWGFSPRVGPMPAGRPWPEAPSEGFLLPRTLAWTLLCESRPQACVYVCM